MSQTTTQTLSLSYPVTIDGVEVRSLTIRRPKVRDQLSASKSAHSPEEQEIQLLANLTDQTSQTIGELDLKDYQALQEAFTGFLS